MRPGVSGYEKLKMRHKQAYGHISKALHIDEAGIGMFASDASTAS